MTDAFLSVLNLSTTASVVALAVVLLRLCMKKAPKWISAALWAFVGARLMFPFALESRISIIPSTTAFTVYETPEADASPVYTSIGSVNNTLSSQIESTQSSDTVSGVLEILSILWIAGVIAFLIYGIISYLSVYHKVRTAIPLKNNIYQSENVKSPFVLGFINPRIIVPFDLDDETLNNVIMHENAHLKRKDHIVKPFAYLLLCFYWFNPFMWLSYILLCRDIEVACDEKVIKELNFEQRKNYAFALLNCKVKNTTVAVCPVAFGEVSVKSRIKNTLGYKKPAMWVVVVAIAASVTASGCLLTNPRAEELYVETTIVDYGNTEYHPAVTKEEVIANSEANNIQTLAADSAAKPLNTNAEETTAEPQTLAQSFEESYNEPIYVEPTEEVYTEPFVPEETVAPVEKAFEETEAFTEQEEYYYYQYNESDGQDYLELPLPTLNQ